MTQAPGRWLADSQTFEVLGIQTDAPTSGEDFIALMEGRHPQTGMWLRSAGADASNKEIDRLNARAQHLRAQRGELGPDELQLSSVNYGLRQGDHVAFIARHRPRGEPRIENGTRGQITNIDQEGALTLRLEGSERRLRLAGQDTESLRLAYAQHVYRQQGATVDRSVVLTGGWQKSDSPQLRAITLKTVVQSIKHTLAAVR